MELFIRLKNGEPFEHPIMGENFRQAFPEVDVNNLPDWVARFERIEQPVLGPYEVYVGVSYGWDNGVVKDIHDVRPMTPEEKAEKIALVQSFKHPEGWVFDEAKCAWVNPQE